MKKLVLLLLVAMVPFMTMAQKRSKKGTNPKTEKKDQSFNEKPSFMIIKGVELDLYHQEADLESEEADLSMEIIMKKHVKPMSEFFFSFDDGEFSQEYQDLTKAARKFRSMTQAVNHAAVYGWEFINSTIVVDGNLTIHYYYMKR